MNKFELNNFIEDLASSKPSPSGGGTCALVGLLGCSLAQMVLNLTVGKNKYVEFDDFNYNVLDELSNLEDELYFDINYDSACFLKLNSLFKTFNYDDDSLNNALIEACKSPIKIMEDVDQLLNLIMSIKDKSNTMLISDIGVCASLINCSCRGALLNIFVNTKLLKDNNLKKSYNDRANMLGNKIIEKSNILYKEVEDYLLNE